MNLSLTKFSFAFTLVELLVVVSISTIFLTMGFSAYRKTQDRQAIHNAIKNVETILRSIQKKAVIGDKDCEGPFLYYKVVITANSNTITSQAICRDSQGETQTYHLNNATFIDGCTIHFYPLQGGLNLISPQQSSFNLHLQLNGNDSLTASLKIAEPGTIITNSTTSNQ